MLHYALDDAAAGVHLFHTLVQIVLGLLGCLPVRHVEGITEDLLCVKTPGRHGADGFCIGGEGDAEFPDGLPPGGAAAAPVIPEAVFTVVGVIRVSRTVVGGDLRVIPGALGLIVNDHRNGRAGGASLE